MGLLEGKAALVTGASRGIGRAIALELARAGARVAVNYRTGESEARGVARELSALANGKIPTRVGALAGVALERAAATGGHGEPPAAMPGGNGTAAGEFCMLVKADLSKGDEARAAMEKVVRQWGRLDILVNNAGITRDRTLRKLTDDDWMAVIETNLNSVFYCTSAAVPTMISQQYGRIINISSVIAQSGNIGQTNYAAAKGGIIAFTKSAALELAKYNITVNAIAPGFTETDMLAAVPPDVQAQIKAKIPLGRFARPEEIAKAVVYLASQAADYITGQQLNVNGGLYL